MIVRRFLRGIGVMPQGVHMVPMTVHAMALIVVSVLTPAVVRILIGRTRAVVGVFADIILAGVMRGDMPVMRGAGMIMMIAVPVVVIIARSAIDSVSGHGAGCEHGSERSGEQDWEFHDCASVEGGEKNTSLAAIKVPLNGGGPAAPASRSRP